ncbi:hypothetical protein P389DRAFT_207483 [Cystobasidium minutum MCA 4210]|uniref:uncharacterized protein n=1 Tax=Cystobasidium minutum MCA 4210 TaxID=1397322 RepID=UPI0034CD78B4|eukprot:jgi/Rhomi1/207483/estExt_Genemark1.C_1_t10392
MHAGRLLLAASVLLAEYVLAQDSNELQKRDEDWSFSPADIVKRKIPATGEKIGEPPAECTQACQDYIAFGVSCAQGKKSSKLTDEELLACACRTDFLTALKSCATCAPQIFEGTDGSNAQTAVDDAAEQCAINGKPVPGFERDPNEDEYDCDPVDGGDKDEDTGDGEGSGAGAGAGAGGSGAGSGGEGSTKTGKPSEDGTETAKPSDGSTSPSKSPSAGSGSTKTATSTDGDDDDDSNSSAAPTAAPTDKDTSDDDEDEDDNDFNYGDVPAGASSSAMGDHFGDFGAASASIDSQRVLVFGIAAVTAVFACLF